MANRYAGGVVPAGNVFDDDQRLIAAMAQTHTSFADAMNHFDHKEALKTVATLVRQANAFIDIRTPWHLNKKNTKETSHLRSATLHTLAEVALALVTFLHVHLPEAAAKIGSTLPQLTSHGWIPNNNERRRLLTGTPMNKPESGFPHLKISLVEAPRDPRHEPTHQLTLVNNTEIAPRTSEELLQQA